MGDNTKKAYVYDPGANLWQKVGLSRAPQRDAQAGATEPSPGRRAPGAAVGEAGPWGLPSGKPDSEGRDAGAEPGLSL